MCRSIKPLFNFEPPATDEEIRAASLQFVRKLSGFQSPSKANEAAFDRAVAEVQAAARRLVDDLTTMAPARNRERSPPRPAPARRSDSAGRSPASVEAAPPASHGVRPPRTGSGPRAGRRAARSS